MGALDPGVGVGADRLRLFQRDVRREHPGLAPRCGEAGTKGDGAGGRDERRRMAGRRRARRE